MERGERKRDRRYYIQFALLGLILVGYIAFALTRPSNYTTYVPFSGKLFDIQPQTGVEMVRIYNGTTGEYVDYSSDSREFREKIDLLNSFRYYFFYPDIPIPSGGFQYYVQLYMEGERVQIEFTKNAILVRGVWYVSSGDFFEKLADPIF